MSRSRKSVAAPGPRRMWRDALQLELSRMDGPQGRTLERIARVVVHNALHGDLDCIREIANRLDGKPAVQLDPVVEEKLERLVIEWGGPGINAKVISPDGPLKTIEKQQ